MALQLLQVMKILHDVVYHSVVKHYMESTTDAQINDSTQSQG